MSLKDEESCGCEGHAPPSLLEDDCIPSIVSQLAEGFTSRKWSSHIEPVAIPSKEEVVDLVLQAQRDNASLLFQLDDKSTVYR